MHKRRRFFCDLSEYYSGSKPQCVDVLEQWEQGLSSRRVAVFARRDTIFFLTDLHIPAWHLCRRAYLSSVVAHSRASFKFRMSKKSSKSGNKKSLSRGHHQSDDEFALDLVDSSAAPAKLKRITINDDDDDVSRPAIKQEKLSKQEAEPHAYPCKGCYRQLAREVEAKLQSRTLSTKTVEVLKLMPHFTADELVDTLVDLLVPPTTSVSLTSPSRVHIQDGDAEW